MYDPMDKFVWHDITNDQMAVQDACGRCDTSTSVKWRFGDSAHNDNGQCVGYTYECQIY